MKNLILISAYNSELTLSDVLLDLKAYPELDILVIDDGSTDRTAEIARMAGVHVISHDKNKGKGAALRTGMDYALKQKADLVITMDADKQHPADKIPDFLDLHAAYPDAVLLGKETGTRICPGPESSAIRFLRLLYPCGSVKRSMTCNAVFASFPKNTCIGIFRISMVLFLNPKF